MTLLCLNTTMREYECIIVHRNYDSVVWHFGLFFSFFLSFHFFIPQFVNLKTHMKRES